MTMSKQQYFYLIAGLPELALTDTHLPFTTKAFLDDMKSKTGIKDFELICRLYYARDNRNLLSILFNKNALPQHEGRYSLQELKKGIDGNFLLPGYINDFISAFKENRNHYTEAEWEAKLTEAYFKETMKTGNMKLYSKAIFISFQ